MTLWLLFCFQEKEGEGGEVKYGGWNLDIFFWTTMCFKGQFCGVTPHGFKKKCAAPNFQGQKFQSKSFHIFSVKSGGVILGAQGCSLAGGYMDAT